MPLPPTLATFAALAGLLTAAKSGWELYRMVRTKCEERTDQQAAQLLAQVTKAYNEKRMRQRDYEYLRQKIQIAAIEKDCTLPQSPPLKPRN
jgi:Na+-translocating ferredoxin:NAD+ oxidoreductase RnfG subunit